MTLHQRVQAALDQRRPERAFDEAARAWSGGTWRERHDAHRLLAFLAKRVPEAAWTRARAEVVRDAGVDRQRPVAAVGRVAFPVVGVGRGCFMEVEVALAEADALPAGLGPEARRGAEDALEAVRGLVPGRSFRVTVSTEPAWDGKSWGLAVALAALSRVHGVAVPDRLVATGHVTPDGQVGSVERRADKVALREEARPRARMLVPKGWTDVVHPLLVRCATLAEAWAVVAPADADLSEAVRAALALDAQGRWDEAAVAAQQLLDEPLDVEERLSMWVLLLLAANHQADGAAQQRWTEALLSVDARGVSERMVARALGSRIVSFVDRLEPQAAAPLLEATRGRSWGNGSLPHVRGPAALVHTLRGAHEEALAVREAMVAVAGDGERARCWGDLADARLRVGDADGALTAADEALRASEEARRRHGYQRHTRAYLTLHRARALRALGRVDEALRVLEAAEGAPGVDPQLRLRLLEAELRQDRAMVQTRWRALPGWATGSPVVQALFERTRARLGSGEAEAALLGRSVFAGLTLGEAARRLPY